MSDFQQRVDRWMQQCFGEEIRWDRTERNYRFTEEALELVQSCGMSKEDVLKLVDYVYSRPSGYSWQEVGGVMVTLAALCSAQGTNMKIQAEAELQRINEPAVLERIREKQKNKPQRSPLPQ